MSEQLDDDLYAGVAEAANGKAARTGEAGGVKIALRRLSDIAARPVSSIWRHRLFTEEFAIIAGPPGSGKSMVMGGVIAAITNGHSPPGGGDVRKPMSVIVLALEDDASRVLRPRYEQMGADLDRVFILEGVRAEGDERIMPFSLRHIAEIEKALDEFPDVGSIFIDPIASALGGVDTFRSNEVRERLDPFLTATSARGVAVTGITHTNKSSTQVGAMRVEGSFGGFIGRARSVLGVGIDPDTGIRGIGVLKSNLGPTNVPVVTYEINEDGHFSWLGENAAIDAQTLFSPAHSAEERSATDEAREAVMAALADGPLGAAEFSRALKDKGVSEKTSHRVRSTLRKEGLIVGERQQTAAGATGPWVWRLADREATWPPDGPDSQVQEYGHLGHLGGHVASKPLLYAVPVPESATQSGIKPAVTVFGPRDENGRAEVAL